MAFRSEQALLWLGVWGELMQIAHRDATELTLGGRMDKAKTTEGGEDRLQKRPPSLLTPVS